MVGTNGVYYPGHHYDLNNTTPESYELQKILRQLADAGCDACVMEVSSQGIMMENRKLILGGVEIPYEYGLLGHSDADVLVHAIMDALLGAAALRDIGRHFPDNDPAYEGADSIELLKKVGEMLEERMYLIENIDATVIAQKPKLLPYIDTMVKNVAEALHLEEDQVNIKATTEEGLGFTGKKEGISAQAICCISKALDLMPDDRIAGGCSGCPGCAKNAEE